MYNAKNTLITEKKFVLKGEFRKSLWKTNGTMGYDIFWKWAFSSISGEFYGITLLIFM